jgi:hypothetical protein
MFQRFEIAVQRVVCVRAVCHLRCTQHKVVVVPCATYCHSVVVVMGSNSTRVIWVGPSMTLVLTCTLRVREHDHQTVEHLVPQC